MEKRVDVFFRDPFIEGVAAPKEWPVSKDFSPVGLERVLQASRKRIVEKFTHGRISIIQASKEFLPFELTVNALDSICDHDVYSATLAPGEPFPQALKDFDGPVVIRLRGGDRTEIDASWASIREFFLYRKDHNSAIVIESDTDIIPVRMRSDADLIFSANDFRLTMQELAEIFDDVSNQNLAIRLVTTGGAASLVAALSDNHFFYWTAEFEEISRAWAERISETPLADQIEPYAWAPILTDDTFKKVSDGLSADSISATFVIELSAKNRLIPYCLSVHLHRINEEKNPGENFRIRDEKIKQLYNLNDGVITDQIKVLTWLNAWKELESVLKYRLIWLSLLSADERSLMLACFPKHPPVELTSVCTAHEFLSLSRSDLSYWAGDLWAKLRFLLPRTTDHPKGTLVEELASNLGRYDKPMNELDEALVSARVSHYTDLFSALVKNPKKLQEYSENDITLSIEVINGTIDEGIACGMFKEVARLAQINKMLTAEYSDFVGNFARLNANVAARCALIAAINLDVSESEHFTDEYRSKWKNYSPQAEELIKLTDSHLHAKIDESLLSSSADIDLSGPYAPWKIATITLFRSSIQSKKSAITYAQGILNRVVWLHTPKWHWWILSGYLFLLYANENNLEKAESIIANSWMPPYCADIVEARIALLEGDAVKALDSVNRLLLDSDIPIIARVFGYTIKIACLLSLDRNSDEIPAIMDVVNWRDVSELIPLFPKKAAKLIVAAITKDDSTRQQSGSEDQELSGILTPRQREVLRLLAAGLTLSGIAQRLYISKETVKSTCRATYRRLNVSSRDQAVEAGKKLGLI